MQIGDWDWKSWSRFRAKHLHETCTARERERERANQWISILCTLTKCTLAANSRQSTNCLSTQYQPMIGWQSPEHRLSVSSFIYVANFAELTVTPRFISREMLIVSTDFLFFCFVFGISISFSLHQGFTWRYSSGMENLTLKKISVEFCRI